MGKYYHASWDFKDIIDIFIPKIPTSALPTEDVTIPRVPLCRNLNECLTAMAYTTNYMYMDCYKELETNYVPLRIYEFELDEDDVLNSEEIVKYVPDALITKEVWSIREIKPIRSFIILPTYFFLQDNYPYAIIDFEYEDKQGIEDLGIDLE